MNCFIRTIANSMVFTKKETSKELEGLLFQMEASLKEIFNRICPMAKVESTTPMASYLKENIRKVNEMVKLKSNFWIKRR